MLGRILDQAFRHFFTLALIAAVVIVPLHVVYTVVFGDVLTVSELHDAIAGLPEGEKIAGVDAARIRTARIAALLILLVELMLLPPMARAARRALNVEDRGGVATVRNAYFGHGDTERELPPVGVIIAALLFTAVTGWLIETSLLTVTRWVPPHLKALLVAAAQITARVAAAPPILSALAGSRQSEMPAKRSSSGSSTGTRDSTSV